MGAGDQRDVTNWVVLELTRAGEIQAAEGCLAQLLREALKIDASHPVFVPTITYMTGAQKVTISLMEGYAFVAAGLNESVYFALEGRCQYVRKVLSTRIPNGMRVLSVIPDARVREMQAQLAQQIASDITLGMRVRVVDGTYTNLEGEVILVMPEQAYVRFLMRSMDLIVSIPRMFLTPISEEDQ